MALIRLTGLSVAFDGAPALRGIDLSITKGEAVGLVGESGQFFQSNVLPKSDRCLAR